MFGVSFNQAVGSYNQDVLFVPQLSMRTTFGQGIRFMDPEKRRQAYNY